MLGFTFWYWRDLEFNSRDWDLRWDKRSWRQKLTLEALRFDQNMFRTNALAHSAAGLGFYHIARENGFSLPASVAATFGTAVFWEYMIEFREYPSLNDIITNTIAGLAVGEPIYQLAETLMRSSHVLTRTIGTLLSPASAFNDWTDGRVRPLEPYDRWGFTENVAHRFRIGGGIGSRSFDTGETRSETLLLLDAELVMLPGYDRPRTFSAWTRPGDFNGLRVRTGFDGRGLNELAFHARTSLFGGYSQRMVREPDGRLRGRGIFLGLGSAFEYEEYARPGGIDHLASMKVLGTVLELSARGFGMRVRWLTEAYATFAMVDALAFTNILPGPLQEDIFYPATFGGRVPSVVGARGYSFALGPATSTRLELDAWRFTLGGELQADRFHAVTGRDRFRDELREPFRISDERVTARGWLSLHPFGPGIGITGGYGWRFRRGWADTMSKSYRDRRVDLGLTLVF
jgi:hypothetical protein